VTAESLRHRGHPSFIQGQQALHYIEPRALADKGVFTLELHFDVGLDALFLENSVFRLKVK
jgi:hypothetical protein